MASTITRDLLVDDSGTAADPNQDGTLIGNDTLQDMIYARIDEMFAGAGPLYDTFTFGGNVTLESGNLSVVGNATVTGTTTLSTMTGDVMVNAAVNAITMRMIGRAADHLARILFRNSTNTTNQAAIDGAPGELRFLTGTTPTQRMSIGSGGDIKIEAPVNGHDFAASAGNAIVAKIRGRAADGIARLLYRDSADTVNHAAIDGLANTLRFLTGVGPTQRLEISDTAMTPAVRINSSTVQPGFLAYLSATQNGLGTGAQVLYDAEVYDNTSNFATGTGVFTAPVTGIYELSAQVSCLNVDPSGGCTMVIHTTQRLYSTGCTSALNAAAQRASVAVFAPMNAGETAFVAIHDQVNTCNVFGSGVGLWTRFGARLAV